MTAIRKTPTLTEEPLDLVGNTYAGILQESIKAIWDNIGGQLYTVGGTANAITAVVLVGTGFDGFKPGMRFSFIPAYTNTGNVDITVNGYTTDIFREDGTELQAGDLVASYKCWLEYDDDIGALILQRGNIFATSNLDNVSYTHVAEILTNQNWVAPWKCRTRIWLFGAAGSGGNATSGTDRNSSGGGGGGTSVKSNFLMQSSDELAFILGAQAAAAGSQQDGNDGGDSTCTGPNSLSMLAGGGKKGVISVSGANPATAPGGLGGTASGGDLNLSGQDGSNCPTNGGWNTSAGGACCLVTELTALADSAVNGGSAFQDYEVVSRIGPFTKANDLVAGDNAGSTPSRGCASGGVVSGVASVAGGKSFAIVEYTGELS